MLVVCSYVEGGLKTDEHVKGHYTVVLIKQGVRLDE